MKKVILVMLVVLVVIVLLFWACKTRSPSVTAAAAVGTSVFPQPSPPPYQPLQVVYNHYKNGLILDEAGKYTVKKGDILANISGNFYGDGFIYPVIMLASRDVVLDPDRIEPGMELIIPDILRNLNDINARANIKRFLFEIADIEDSRNRSQTARGIRDRANSL